MSDSPAQTLFAEMVAGADARATALRDAMNAYGAAVKAHKAAVSRASKARIAFTNLVAAESATRDALTAARSALDTALADLL